MVRAQGTNADLGLGAGPWSLPQTESEKEAPFKWVGFVFLLRVGVMQNLPSSPSF